MKCEICGYNKDSRAFHKHHEKDGSVRLICANCHYIQQRREEWKEVLNKLEVLVEVYNRGKNVQKQAFQVICDKHNCDAKDFITGTGKPITYIRGERAMLTTAGKGLIEKLANTFANVAKKQQES